MYGYPVAGIVVGNPIPRVLVYLLTRTCSGTGRISYWNMYMYVQLYQGPMQSEITRTHSLDRAHLVMLYKLADALHACRDPYRY